MQLPFSQTLQRQGTSRASGRSANSPCSCEGGGTGTGTPAMHADNAMHAKTIIATFIFRPVFRCYFALLHWAVSSMRASKSPPTAGIGGGRQQLKAATATILPAPSTLLDELSVKGKIMNLIIWLVVGGLLGWIASLVMRTDGQQGILLNVVVGIVGALIAGFVIAPMLGTGTINTNDFSMSGLLVSFVGALILLAIVNLVRRGTAR